MVGGAFASIPGAAWAACKQPFSKCTANTQCCSRQCIKNPRGNGKICGCPTGKTLCPAGNQCVTCTNTGEVVNLTTCKCECPSDMELCKNECVSKNCDEGKTFNPATCSCEEVCPEHTLCGPAPDGRECFCQTPVEGQLTCTSGVLAACNRCCTSSNQCPRGHVCHASGVCQSTCSGNIYASCKPCTSDTDCPAGSYCHDFRTSGVPGAGKYCLALDYFAPGCTPG